MSVSLRSAKEPPARPPRLQPSPSLPNLRVRNTSIPLHLTRPQPTPNKLSSPLPSLTPSGHSPKASFKHDDSHQDSRSCKPSKNQHYLTPPLTPASSLKSDSTDTDSSDLNTPSNDHLVPAPSDPPSGDTQQSRFLIIGNVPNDLSEDIIGPYFHSLASLHDSTPQSGMPVAQGSPTTSQAIQTIFYRFQENRAIIVAFYDTRDADRVKRHIETKSSQSHHDRKREASWEEALSCLFVTPDHFLKLLGPSAAVLMTLNEGSFYVSVGDAINVRDHDRSSSLTTWGRIRFTVPVKLKSVLTQFGELKSFLPMEANQGNFSQLFMIEYYDIRAAESAWESLDGRVVENMKLRLIQKDALRDGTSGPWDFEEETADGGIEGHLGDEHAAEPKTPTTTTYLSHSQATSSSNAVPFPVLNDVVSSDYRCEFERSHNDSLSASSALNGCPLPTSERQKPSFPHPFDKYASITVKPSFTDSSRSWGGTFTSDQFGRRGSNNLLFDAVQSRTPYKRVDLGPSAMNPTGIDVPQGGSVDTGEAASGITEPHSTSYSSAQPYYGREYFNHSEQYAADPPVPAPWVSSPAAATQNAGTMQYAVPSQSPMPCSSMIWDSLTGNWVTWPPHNLVAEQWATYPSPSVYYPLASHAVPYPFPQQASPSVPIHPYTPSQRVYSSSYPSSPRTPPENNQLDIRKIEQGLDTRTTVMVKNIPNKMSDKELIAFINKVCPRRIDFLYLRMDFQNGCNVGYAFVNFISVQDLLTFAKLKLNEKWNMYSSEKVLQMSYANYQGKEALVEKFKNSCIMDEREEWRPKIFYSEAGPKQGLPEEFPKPTHMRRKERSSYNRGALFVPGINSGSVHHSHSGKTFLNANSPNQRHSPNRPSFQGDERRQRRAYHGSPVHADADVSDEDGVRQR